MSRPGKSTRPPLDVLRETINVTILKLKSVYGVGAQRAGIPLPHMYQNTQGQAVSDGEQYEMYVVPDEVVGEEWPEVQEYY
jgi:hypothetical protein